MRSFTIECPKCRTPLTAFQSFNQADFQPCPYCNAPLQVEIFPAFFRPAATGVNAEGLVVDGEASCFYHPVKKAVRPCDGCGRFLCALCDCELHGEHFCPACLESGGKKGRIKSLQKERARHDQLALTLAIISFPLLITAPIAIFFAIRSFKTPSSLVVSPKPRAILAIVLASIALAGWGLLIVFASIDVHG